MTQAQMNWLIVFGDGRDPWDSFTHKSLYRKAMAIASFHFRRGLIDRHGHLTHAGRNTVNRHLEAKGKSLASTEVHQ